MMFVPPSPIISAKVPSSCTTVEIEIFKALVVKGDEVSKDGLSDRIVRAEALGFAYMGSVLIGIGALKKPSDAHRASVFTKSGTILKPEDFPLELGWFFVEKNYRGRGISKLLIQKLVDVAGKRRVFATSRVDNKLMHRSIENAGFTQVGHAYASDRGEYSIMLFVGN